MIHLLLSLSLLASIPEEIGIVEELGASVPGNIELIQEDGSKIRVEDFLGQPTFLGLVYYRCPGICVPFLEGMARGFGQITEGIGRDFRIVTVSFDPNDTPAVARIKKAEIVGRMKKRIPEESWLFLTADTENIRRLTESVGFRYMPSARTNGNYIHTSSMIALSPSGKIVRYMNGTDFLPAVIKIAVAEARDDRLGATIISAIDYCFDYDPDSRRYMLDIKKIFGASISIGAILFFGALVAARRKKRNETES